MIRVLSLGAGVQSTTLALMAAKGEITPMPDCAIFADTKWEPAEVYTHLDRLEKLLPFPVYRVTVGDIRDTILTGSYDPIPWHTASGIGRRQCTNQFKLTPIRRKVRELLGGQTPKAGCEMWLGISLDEAHRMKPSRLGYIMNRWPLIDAGISRAGCLAKLERWAIQAPRSACCGCPFLSSADWRLRSQQPEWEATLALSRRLAATGQFMHYSRKPLDEIDFRSWDDRGQADLFGNECEGMCGT